MVLLVDLSWPQLWIAIASLIVALATLVTTLVAVIITKKIETNQQKKKDINYMICSIVEPFSILETDAMLLSQGTYDKELYKDELDRLSLLSISKAKNFAISSRNNNLFKYLDSLITGETKENVGEIIDDYFEERTTIIVPLTEKKLKKRYYISKNVENIGKAIRDKYLKKIRKYRSITIDKLLQIIAKSN